MFTPAECLAKATEAHLYTSPTIDTEAKAMWAQSEGLWARLASMGDAQEKLEKKLRTRGPD